MDWNLKLYAILKALKIGSIYPITIDKIPESVRNFLHVDSESAQKEINSELQLAVQHNPPYLEIDNNASIVITKDGGELFEYHERRLNEIDEDNKQYQIQLKGEDFPAHTIEDLESLAAVEIEWAVDKLIPKNSFSLISGKSKSYKSYGALHIGLSVAAGLPVFGKYQTRRLSVLYLDEEDSNAGILQKIKHLMHGMDLNKIENFYVSSRAGILLDSPLWIDRLSRWLENKKCDVIILDVFRRFVSFDENSATDVNEFFNTVLKPLMIKHSVTIIALHHNRKTSSKGIIDYGDELRGSSEFRNLASSILLFDRRGTDRIILRHEKSRYIREEETQQILLKWSGNDSLTMDSLGTFEEALELVDLCGKAILELVESRQQDQYKTQEIVIEMKKLGYSEPTTKRALAVLTEQLKIRKPKRGAYTSIGKQIDDYTDEKIASPGDGEEESTRGWKEVEAAESFCDFGNHQTVIEYNVRDDVDHKWKPCCVICFNKKFSN